ncbi:AraC family transcriptional regulator [Neobacillus cucumis]|uniref:AraC family transcriptional regulator n=1 Tax=Neobacillus cucumis TaxID=1740721 RepID=UPI001963677D|nr:helix-turn-helix domain-containing protein [Neobacillus cucumis]MBM7655517.1 AraC-like DNA-binding protein/mannose-6-phosphate isomerase-like protein (cupin superfamily) [Neobacillus cucumis]
MNHQQLDEYLRKLDQIEEIQIKTHQNINEFEENELIIESVNNIIRMPEEYFFDKGPIFISKHHRFADMYVHMHSFIEINYVYSGVCKQNINGKEVILTQGQVCMLDVDVPHSIQALGVNDILINIIIKKEIFAGSFIGQLGNTGIVSNFLANAISENQRHDHYIMFHSENNENLQYIIKNMICEFLDEQDYSIEMVQAYLPVILTELMRVYQLDKNFELKRVSGKANIIDIIHFIERHYKDCSLTSLAEKFNFNPNYLGNMLKEQTGKTFLELIQMQRMIRASVLLKNTTKGIDDIAFEIGYESSSFFHRKFKQYFGCTPSQFRKKGK